MFWCCCLRLHRHQLHLASYGCVSFSLILTGIVFTVFAVFQKDSQIGKVWLAGPVLIVVGSVLCGKVMIDWGPAMERGRSSGSLDSRFIEEFGYSNLLSVGKSNLAYGGSPEIAHHLKIPVKNVVPPRSSTGFGSAISSSPPFAAHLQNVSPSLSNSVVTAGQFGFDCITYGLPDIPQSPASPLKMGELKEMVDKTTQAVEEGCERCATLWSILDRRKKTATTGSKREESRSPKVIGQFVFSELNNGGPSSQQPHSNYGTLVKEGEGGEKNDDNVNSVMEREEQQNDNWRRSAQNNDNRKSSKRKLYSQGETLIMNERSFLI